MIVYYGLMGSPLTSATNCHDTAPNRDSCSLIMDNICERMALNSAVFSVMVHMLCANVVTPTPPAERGGRVCRLRLQLVRTELSSVSVTDYLLDTDYLNANHLL